MTKLKSEAGLSHNWNSLFLGQNAVADIIAKTYNTSKENVKYNLNKKLLFVYKSLC